MEEPTRITFGVTGSTLSELWDNAHASARQLLDSTVVYELRLNRIEDNSRVQDGFGNETVINWNGYFSVHGVKETEPQAAARA